MSSSDVELEEQLAEAGNKLVDPPASVDELLPLLDQVEGCLSRVEQSPSKSMQSVLSTSLKALVSDKLFKHEDIDVRVSVASCISEITRISAPDAPYEDEKMKEVFQLIVSSFENLSDKTSRSYAKRSSILETVAKVRSCVVMLDLECDALILEMFQHFLKEIREYHPENVFSAMETIMALVIEESEDISPELLSPILATVKKDNEDVSPIVKKLGERVLENCASKLKPYLAQVLKSLGVCSDDYSRVVSSICMETTGMTDQSDVNVDAEQKLDEEPAEEVATPQQVDTAPDRSPQSVMSNGETAPDRSPQSVMSNGETKEEKDDSLTDSVSVKKEEHGHESTAAETTKSSNGEPDKLGDEDATKKEPQPEQTAKRRGRKPKSATKAAKSAEDSRSDDKEIDKPEDQQDEHGNEVPSSACEKQSVEENLPSESEKEAAIESSSPEDDGNEPAKDASPSQSQDLPEENLPKKVGRGRKKKNIPRDATPAVEIAKKVSEAASEDEVETPKKKETKIADEKSSKADKDDAATSDSEAKSLKPPTKKTGLGSSSGGGTSTRQPEEKKRLAKGKMVSEKQIKTFAKKDMDKEIVSSSKALKKRGRDENHVEDSDEMEHTKKRTPAKEEISHRKDYGEELVGSRIKVWWPLDKAFYEGKVSSFDSVKKRHMVSYIDGDVEVLHLRRERWKLVSDDSASDQEEAEDEESPEASPGMPLRKKGKMKLDSSTTKKEKDEISSKKGGAASGSGKSKEAATASGRKFKSGGKTESKSENDSGGEARHPTSRTGSKAMDTTSEKGARSKDSEVKTPKTAKFKENEAGSSKVSAKSKQETPKTGKPKQEEEPPTPRGKTAQSGGKSNANGSGKMKGTMSSASKAQGSKSAAGKKRRRGF